MLPIAILLYFALSTAAAVPFALVYVLVYPGFITAERTRQSAFRYAYLWAGWADTLASTVHTLQSYWYTATLGARDAMRTVRRKAWAYQYEFHPADLALAALTLPLGGALLAAALLLLLAGKLPFIILRAYDNHFRAAGDWFRGPLLSAAWFAAVPLMPLGAALLVPAAAGFAFYQAGLAAAIVLRKNGAIVPPAMHLWAVLTRVHRDSTK